MSKPVGYIADHLRRVLINGGSAPHTAEVQHFFKDEIKSRGWYTNELRKMARRGAARDHRAFRESQQQVAAFTQCLQGAIYNQRMKLIACAVMLLALVGAVFAAERTVEKGTLVSVVLHETSSPADNYPGAQPGRVPPGPVTYTYEFTVRLGCMDYSGLYDSYRKNFAQRFKPGEEVVVRATKRLLYMQEYGQEETLRMSLSSHHDVENCKPAK